MLLSSFQNQRKCATICEFLIIFEILESREECGIVDLAKKLSNEYLIAAIGVDAAENGLSKV